MRPAGLCASFLPDSFNNRQCLLSQYILSVRFAYLSPTTWFRRVNNGRVVRSSTQSCASRVILRRNRHCTGEQQQRWSPHHSLGPGTARLRLPIGPLCSLSRHGIGTWKRSRLGWGEAEARNALAARHPQPRGWTKYRTVRPCVPTTVCEPLQLIAVI